MKYREFCELMEHAWKTVMQAQELIKEAVEHKHGNPDLAAAYYRVAGNRCTDADLLIKQAEMCVDRAETAQDEDFDEIDVLWSADKRRLLERMGHIKIYMDMYR